jgi:hypothetical protein
MSESSKLKPGKPQPEQDYYINSDGNLVFTASYLLKRGFCCGNGCKHCPYGTNAIKK